MSRLGSSKHLGENLGRNSQPGSRRSPRATLPKFRRVWGRMVSYLPAPAPYVGASALLFDRRRNHSYILRPAQPAMKIGLNRGRATTRIASTTGLPGVVFIPIAHVGCTDTAYHENGRGDSRIAPMGGLPGHVAQGMTGKHMNMRLQGFSLLYMCHFVPFPSCRECGRWVVPCG